MKKALYYISCVLFALLLVSCNRLSDKKMVALLTDFYLYDELSDKFHYQIGDSVSIPLSLFEKHHVSQKEFEATMQYYTTHPKKMKEVFMLLDSTMKLKIAEYQEKIEIQEMAESLWTEASTYKIDTVQLPEKIAFHIPIDTVGNYTLKAIVTLFENDSTRMPQMVGYFLTKEKNQKRDTINRKVILFNKSTDPEQLSLSFSIKDTNINAFEGYWLKVDDDTLAVRQHTSLEKLRILYNNDSTKTILSDFLKKGTTSTKEGKDGIERMKLEEPVNKSEPKPFAGIKQADKVENADKKMELQKSDFKAE